MSSFHETIEKLTNEDIKVGDLYWFSFNSFYVCVSIVPSDYFGVIFYEFYGLAEQRYFQFGENDMHYNLETHKWQRVARI